MDAITIEQHKLIANSCKDLLNVVFSSDLDTVTNILNKSQSKIDQYNNNKLTITDISVYEIGIWNANIKKLIYGRYLNPILKKMKNIDEDDYEYICESHRIYDEDGSWLFDEEKICKSCKKELLKTEKLWFEHNDNMDNLRKEFSKACNNTVFEQDIRDKYTLLRRMSACTYHLNPLETIINNSIHIEILTTFFNQNKELLIKHN